MLLLPALELPVACAIAAAFGYACRPSPPPDLSSMEHPESETAAPMGGCVPQTAVAFNCAPTPRIGSSALIWVAQRPGRDSDSPTEGDIDCWVEHMQRRGVSRVLCLLGEKHLRLYTHLQGATLQQAVERRGLKWAGVTFSRDKPLLLHLIAAARQLRDAERCGENVVVHCSAGCGRSAAVVVAWLCGRGGHDFETAVAQVATDAKAEGVQRQPLDVGEQDLREACEELRLQWGPLGLAAGSARAVPAACESRSVQEKSASSAREMELALQLKRADEAVLQISNELREVKRQHADVLAAVAGCEETFDEEPMIEFDC